MKKIDKTKNNIKADKLNENTRKELFSKFVGAGGKIISDYDDEVIRKSGKTKHIFDREKQLAFKEKEEAQRKAIKNTEKHETKKVTILSPIKKPGLLASFSQKLIIRFRLFLLNITDFSATTFNNKFLETFSNEYKTALLRIKLLYLDIFKHNKEIGLQILFKLDKINPQDIKLIEKISIVYNEIEINNIMGDYTLSPQTPYIIDKVKEPVLTLFTKLYLLKPFAQKIYLAFEKAISIHMELTKDKPSEYKLKRKNLKNDLYSIFEKLYFSLYWLFCKYNNRIIPLGSYEIEEILKIDKNQKQITNIKHTSAVVTGEQENIEPEVEKTEDKSEEKPKAEEATVLSKEVKAGMDLLSRFNFNNIEKLRVIYDKPKRFSLVKNNNKILLIYFIFMEFDLEYSFLLTTNKIKYKFGYISSDHTTFKEKLLNHYDEIKKCMDLFMEYSNLNDLCIKTENEKPLTNDRYISYIKNLNALIKKRDQVAITARYAVLNFMDKVSNVFLTLIKDIEGFNKIIENAHDIIDFEVTSEIHRNLNKKSIYEALKLAFYFTLGVKQRLNSEGDLSGNLEFDDKDKTLSSSSKEEIPAKDDSVTDSNTSISKESTKTTKGESIINELDDIFSK